jgi:hypothetical protein
MTPEQIIGKWAVRLEDTLFNDEWLNTTDVGCAELLETLEAELQPLADLIRAAQQFADKWGTGQVTMDEAIEMKEILEKLGSI